jgi:hypothetical protein
MSDLLVSSVTPVLSGGTGLRTYGVVAALARSGPVELAYVPFGGGPAAAAYGSFDKVTLRQLNASRGFGRAAAYARTRLRTVPHHFARGVSPQLVHAADGAAPDVRVIADGPVVAAALLPLAGRREVVYLAHNLESSGFRGPALQAPYERFERLVLRAFAETWMATRGDAEGARALAGEDVAVRYVPNVVDVAATEPSAPAPDGPIMFVGDFTYEPNREAFEFLTGAVMPWVWQRAPQARLVVVGRGLPDWQGDARVTVPGFVENLAAAYRAAAVAAVPLLSGGGSPLKFIEALSYGLPVVATPHAARLLEDAVAGRDFVVGGGAEGFAAAIGSLLEDPDRAAAIGAAGRGLAAGSYSVEALTRLLA